MLFDLLPIIFKDGEPVRLLGNFIYTVVFCLLGWVIYTRFAHPLHDIPGPIWASISRFWLVHQVSTGKAEYTQRDLHDQLGPLVRIAPDEISIADPNAIKIIYGINSGFSKTDFYPPFAPNISAHGDHFTQLDETKHAARRKLVSSAYSMSTVLESEPYINNCTDVFLGKMKKFAERKQAIDIGEWCQWYAFDVVGELFFGKQFGFMSDEHDFDNYIHNLDTLLPGIAISCVLPSFLRPLQSLIGPLIPTIRDSVRGFDNIRAAGRHWVLYRMQQMNDHKVNRSDLLEKFFKIREQKSDFDIPEIQNEACVAIFAGSDTTAIAIRSILYHLMKNPDAYEKLVAEIDEATRDGRLSTPHIKYTEATSLPYLVASCKEGMRLHPSVGLSLPRYVPEGGKIIAGRFFPAGTKVGVSAPVVHFNKSIFGQDAAVFNPDRWLYDSDAATTMDRHMFQFGAGSRTCIGKNISLAEIHKVIPQLLRSYRIELADPKLKWDTHNFWFNKQTGLRVYVTARERGN